MGFRGLGCRVWDKGVFGVLGFGLLRVSGLGFGGPGWVVANGYQRSSTPRFGCLTGSFKGSFTGSLRGYHNGLGLWV